MNNRLTAIVFSAAALAMAASAQTNSTLTGVISGGGVLGVEAAPAQMIFVSGVMPGGSVTGRPYSAQQETQTVQTLFDGTHITQSSQKVMYYRDSLGRTRTERTMSPPPGFPNLEPPPAMIEIFDPVAGFHYMLDQKSHVAHRTPLGPARAIPATRNAVGTPTAVAVLTPTPLPPPPPPPVAPAAVAKGSQRPMPAITHDSLGTQTFEGVLAEGNRTTTVYPIGFFGNDRPLTMVSEMWMSRELGMAVLQKTSDPRSGDTTTRLSGISQSEPDPSLFQIPADYQIVDPTAQQTK
jgi:hypothetical protein